MNSNTAPVQIHFHFPVGKVHLPHRTQLKTFVAELFQHESTPLISLTYVFCSDAYLLGINQEFLSHDDYTDIITFSLGEGSAPVVGEIYISVERTTENARSLGVSRYHELLRVIFHGALHLCGYGDKKPADKQLMTQKEDYYLSKYLKG